MKKIANRNWRQWLKESSHPLAIVGRTIYFAFRNLQFPLIRPLHRTLYVLHKIVTGFFVNFIRIFYWTPLFRSRMKNNPRNLHLYAGLPLVLGNLDIYMGDRCRVSGRTTFTGRPASAQRPQLIIGDNVGIGGQTLFSVAHLIKIGDNVRMGGRVYLAGFPGHPLDPIARAQGLPDLEEQVGDIVLEDNVWLAVGVTVTAGVTIGRNTIVAAGSVVTRDLPPDVLAGGVPARVIRTLENIKEP